MELRIGIQEGLLDTSTHKAMKMIVGYISTMYNLKPALMDLEGAIFENVDEVLCSKIMDDVKQRFRRQLRFLEIHCL
jgi:hypothetical protein